jgi:hypothetical protein
VLDQNIINTSAKGSHVLGLKHLCLCEWQLICGNIIFKMFPFHFSKCPSLFVDISENVLVLLKNITGTQTMPPSRKTQGWIKRLATNS